MENSHICKKTVYLNNKMASAFLLNSARKVSDLLGIKNIDSSLRLKAKHYIKHNYRDLHESRSKQLLNFIIDRKNWWVILFFVLFLFFVTPLLNTNLINFIEIKPETAKSIVDQRTANFAAIISMTLVIVGFLINSLALKEPNAYKVLFKYSYFYPIIYFTLCTISCFIILSTIRDNFTSSTFDYFSRSVIAGTYAALLILILIGVLFNRILVFTDSKQIKKIYHEDLINDSKKIIKNSLLISLSEQYYETFMLENKISKFDFLEGLFHYNVSNSQSESADISEMSEDQFNDLIPVQNEIYDINLRKIRKYIELSKKDKSDDLRYKSIKIGDFMGESTYCISPAKAGLNSDREKRILNNSVVFNKNQNKKSSLSNSREYFDSKLEEAVNDNKEKDIESLLESYLAIYELKNKYKV
jgi:uncharacterized membrane protein YiaA